MRTYTSLTNRHMLELLASLKISTFLPGFLGGLLAGLINHNTTRECIILMVIGSIASYALTPLILHYNFAPEWGTGIGIMVGYLARPVLEEIQKKLPRKLVDKMGKNI